MADFTLDDIVEAAEKKYSSLKIHDGEYVIELQNVLRLPKEKRRSIMAMQDKENSAENVDDTVLEVLLTACRTEGQAERLKALIGDDLGLAAHIMELWSGETQLGEARPSQS